jgi:hypothetical protein
LATIARAHAAGVRLVANGSIAGIGGCASVADALSAP